MERIQITINFLIMFTYLKKKILLWACVTFIISQHSENVAALLYLCLFWALISRMVQRIQKFSISKYSWFLYLGSL